MGGDRLAADLAAALTGRAVLRVSTADFLRPAGERFEYGREDPDHFRQGWLDAEALRREVLDAAPAGRYLPRLWDAVRDRSARVAVQPVPPQAVLLVDGIFLLGRQLPAELTVHVALSPAALLRRGVPRWQLPAFTSYDAEVAPSRCCDVLVRAEDPQRPAVLVRCHGSSSQSVISE